MVIALLFGFGDDFPDVLDTTEGPRKRTQSGCWCGWRSPGRGWFSRCPGGPRRSLMTTDPVRSIGAAASLRPGRCCWPTISSRLRGRIRSARGVLTAVPDDCSKKIHNGLQNNKLSDYSSMAQGRFSTREPTQLRWTLLWSYDRCQNFRNALFLVRVCRIGTSFCAGGSMLKKVGIYAKKNHPDVEKIVFDIRDRLNRDDITVLLEDSVAGIDRPGEWFFR